MNAGNPKGVVLAVTSAKGGVGKSVFAANLAVALVRETGKRVFLADMDMAFPGDACLALGVQNHALTMSSMAKVMDSLGPNTVKGFVGKHSSGVFFLPAYNDSLDSATITPQVVTRLFDLLASAFDLVVADLATGFSDINLASLEQSDHVFLLLTPDVPAMEQTVRALDILKQLSFPSRSISLILNAYDPKGAFSQTVVSDKLGREIAAVIPHDKHVFTQALSRGEPAIIASPRNEASRAVEKLASKLWESGITQAVSGGRVFRDEMAFHSGNPTPLGLASHHGTSQAAGGVIGLANQLHKDLRLKVHQRLIEEMELNETEVSILLDPEKASRIRSDTRHKVEHLMDEEAGHITDRTLRKQIVETILNEALGLGPLEFFLADDEVTEIMCNGPSDIFIEKQGKIFKTDAGFLTPQHLRIAIDRIVAPLGRRVDELCPMVDARLPDGSRVNAVIPPLALGGPFVTIRKFSNVPLTADDLVARGSFNEAINELLRCCVAAKLNMVISGGTGSGKTTLLNVLGGFIPPDERLVTIEESAELQLPQKNICRMESRQPNVDGSGEVTIRELVRNALRMRPDRIIVGECRSEEALDMLQAMNTGHEGSLTTLHANSPRQALGRLETMISWASKETPLRAIRQQITSTINMVIQLSRMPDGSRKVTNIIEVSGMEGETITTQDIFSFQQTGIDKNGKVEGRYVASGLIPRFMNELEQRGYPVPREIFMESY